MYHIFGLIFVIPEKVGACFVEDLIATLPSGGKHQHLACYLKENSSTLTLYSNPSFGHLAAVRLHLTTRARELFHSHL
jgi:hypothetical protein